MSERAERAVEAAAILSCATFDQDRIWHNLLDEEEREDYRKDAAAMLRAALPHLTAQDVPHVAREAWAIGRAMGLSDHAGSMMAGRSIRTPNPYAEEATDDNA